MFINTTDVYKHYIYTLKTKKTKKQTKKKQKTKQTKKNKKNNVFQTSLEQHHDLEPQEEQSWQQQNIEDTKNNYDSFFDGFVVVKNGWKFEKKYWNETLKTSNTSTSQHVFQCFKIWYVYISLPSSTAGSFRE